MIIYEGFAYVFKGLEELFDYTTPMGRREFWVQQLGIVIMNLVIGAVGLVVLMLSIIFPPLIFPLIFIYGALYVLIAIVMFLIQLSAMVRRLRDTGLKTAAITVLLLVSLIFELPAILLIVALVLEKDYLLNSPINF